MNDYLTIEQHRRTCRACGGCGYTYPDDVLGAFWRGKRREEGIDAKEIAEAAGVSPQYLSDLEHGRRKWSPALSEAYLVAIARVRVRRRQEMERSEQPPGITTPGAP